MTPIELYWIATDTWREANATRERAARTRARALRDAHDAGMDIPTIAQRVRLSPARVEELITKAREAS
ncbi:hypothetical protein GCM10010182_67420 [Actinomadura cremea]|nr:hypothetical protein GCM10010182_67420 [Actinomadura cremea]